MAVINTNITALIGQQNLTRSGNALQTSMERLSSGLRINSAADDAAGQAIANRMSAQVTGLSQAQRNANDGISVAQTAEGALNQVNDNLQRIRELTVQATNGTNSDSDLKSVQAEIDQRLSEINRISDQTSFNGVKVLADDRSLTIQVGANDGETITLNLKQINAGQLGLDGFHVTGDSAATASDMVGRMDTGDTVVANSVTWTKEANGTYSGDDGTTLDNDAALMSKIAADDADVTADIDGTEYTLAADGTVTDGTDQMYISRSDNSLTTTPDAATADPLKALDDALSTVDDLRSDLGAIQNRFESAIDNLSTTTTNLSAARSRIEDADYAVEVSNMTRAQILQQAGTSVLSQANQVPQTVLSLLR